MHKSYKQIIQKAGKKDLADLFQKRKDFLEKNFSALPGIKESSRSREDAYFNQ